MELYLAGPALVVLGVLLVHMAVLNSQPVKAQATSASIVIPRLPGRDKTTRAPQPPASNGERGLTQTDVLLADVLTEMLELKEQMAGLRTDVEKLTVDLQELADRNKRKRPPRAAA